MSVQCHNCHAKPSRGSIGAIRWCFNCARDILDKPGLRRRKVIVEVMSHGKPIGYTVWVPDSIALRERGRAS